MINARYDWHFPEVKNGAAVKNLMETFGISELIAKILVNRGYEEVEQAQAFLRPDIDQLYDPYLLHDMDAAIERIQQAIDHGERIVVYGDYDVDGITATAIMTMALEILGADVDYFVPNRFTDGYGPNLSQYQRLAADGMNLLITVDNGVSGQEPIAWLMANGVDVIVTDHHELPVTLPEAVAVVHPRHPTGHYPFGGLSGAGVAFKVASALLEVPADELLDLAAIGAIADVMDIVDENRTIVALGLENLQQDARPGLAALLASAGTDPASLDSATIGFTIGPRLNALGRMGDASLGVRLLLTDDPLEAGKIAATVEQLNQERRELVDVITAAALEMGTALDDDPVLVVAGTDWHEGVLGIVAARLVEQTGKPAIVLNTDAGVLKGSARSVPAFDIFKALDGHRDLMTAFGGHASAAGMTVPAENLQPLRDVLRGEANQQALATAGLPTLQIADTLSGADFNADNYAALKILAPFGAGNPEPLFAVPLTGVENVKTMSQDKHLRLTGMTKTRSVPIVAFGRGDLATDLTSHFDELTFVGTMSENTFNGQTSYQLLTKDVQAVGSSILDWRTNKLTNQLFSQPAHYVFFNQKMYQQATGFMKAPAQAVWWEDAFNMTSIGTLAMVDLPADLAQLHELLAFVPAQRWAPIFYTKHSAYLQKTPTKAEFGLVYKFAVAHHDVNVRAQLQDLAAYLKIDLQVLVLILQVFNEAKFVKIENGLMNSLPSPAKVALETMPSYQKFLAKRELEKDLIYSTTAQLDALLSKLAQP